MDPFEDDDEDEQLRRAIGLSLLAQEEAVANQKASQRQVIMISDDEDYGNESKLSEPRPKPSSSDESSRMCSTEGTPAPAIAIKSSLLGLDRKAMEAERLARRRQIGGEEVLTLKRKTSISPPPLSRATGKRPRHEADGEPLIKHQTPRQIPEVSSAATCNDLTSTTSKSKLEYPNGAVKKTWCFGFPRQDDIKIEEVLQSTTLQLAVLSSFQWDIDWLFSKLDTTRTKLILAMQAKEEHTRRQYRAETASIPNLRLCFPPMLGTVNCMHSKLMLLSHPTYLRVTVPTANLVAYDWGETGVLENTVFVIDLPRLPAGVSGPKDENLTPFARELMCFCAAMELHDDVLQSMRSFDFSATAPYAFVHSIGGTHTGAAEPWRHTGYAGLGAAVRQLGLATDTDIGVDFLASSLGAIGMDFLSALYLAAKGDDGRTELDWRSAKGKAKAAAEAEAKERVASAVERDFRIYFPSKETVVRSRGGPSAAGPICFQKRWYESEKFPKPVLRDCTCTREGLLMHNKV